VWTQSRDVCKKMLEPNLGSCDVKANLVHIIRLVIACTARILTQSRRNFTSKRRDSLISILKLIRRMALSYINMVQQKFYKTDVKYFRSTIHTPLGADQSRVKFVDNVAQP